LANFIALYASCKKVGYFLNRPRIMVLFLLKKVFFKTKDEHNDQHKTIF